MKLCLELARVAGPETRQETMEPYQYVRLPADGGPKMTSEKIKSYCLEVNSSQISLCKRISMQQWLRTAIVPQESIVRRIINNLSVSKRKVELEVYNNVVPRQAYLRRLECVIPVPTSLEHVCSGPGGFFPICDLREEDPPRLSCTDCALAKQMKIETDCMDVDESDNFLEVQEQDLNLKSMKHIGKGSEGEIHRMKCRKGTVLVRKTWTSEAPGPRNPNFERELEVARTVSHPNIVHCFGCSCVVCGHSTNYHLFMEFLDQDLERFLNDRYRESEGSESPFLFRESLDVLWQIAEAMSYLHKKKFVHGDLKAGNILVSKLGMPHSDENFYLIKVTDFGCTQRVGTSETFDFRIGSPSILHPKSGESVNVEKQNLKIPQKIDVYSFGIVAYQVLSGVTTSMLYTDIPVNWIERVMLPDTDERQLRPNRIWNEKSRKLETVKLDHYDGSANLLSLIERCWASSPQSRPSLQDICCEIRELIKNFSSHL